MRAATEMGAAPVAGSVGVRLSWSARTAWGAIEPLWVGGLALLCLVVGHAVLTGPWLGLRGKRYDWGQYLVAGVVFPALLFGVPLLWRWRGWSTAPAAVVKRLLVLGAVLAVALFGLWGVAEGGWERLAVPGALALAQTVLMNRPSRRGGMVPARLVAVFVVALVGWTVVGSLSRGMLARPTDFLAAFAVAFLLACAAAWGPDDGERPVRVRPWTPANAAALAGIGLMSLSTEGLFGVAGEAGALHHWAPWVGSAELVRQGGWLLWDVPSMYGLLSIVALAVLPAGTPWQGLYLLTALASFVVGGGIFLALRTLRPGPLTWCFALAVAIVVPMFPPWSPVIFPNWAAYRYVWCFVLLAILVWEYVSDERSRRHGWILGGGCVAWVVGVLWSPESAFFCTAAWLPAYVAIVLRRAATGGAGRRRGWRCRRRCSGRRSGRWRRSMPPGWATSPIGRRTSISSWRWGPRSTSR